jgi:hypothetical protein
VQEALADEGPHKNRSGYTWLTDELRNVAEKRGRWRRIGASNLGNSNNAVNPTPIRLEQN